MVPKMNPLSVLVFLLLGGFCITCGEQWCYDKPGCDPNTWASLGYCGGKKQSPINIVTKKALSDSSLGHIRFLGYEDQMKPKVLENTGHYPDIKMASGANISSLGLPGTYALKSFHFHWGTYRYPGSEHTIDGLQYPMELHIVHTKNNMSEEEAKKDPEGFAVLGFFLKKSSKAPIVSAWKTLGRLLERIPEKGNSVNLHGEFSLGALLNTVDTNTYYRYHGSLTTPDCNEAVIWTIFPEPIEIHHTVFKRFIKSMYFTNKEEKRPMQNNYRPLQFLNNRKVLRFTEK